MQLVPVKIRPRGLQWSDSIGHDGDIRLLQCVSAAGNVWIVWILGQHHFEAVIL